MPAKQPPAPEPPVSPQAEDPAVAGDDTSATDPGAPVVEEGPSGDEPTTPDSDLPGADGPTPTGEVPAASPTDPPPDAPTVQAPPGAADPVGPTADEVDLADPLGPVDSALDGLEAQGFRVTGRRREVRAFQGEVLVATLTGTENDLLRYVLEQVAADGYVIQLAPVAADTFDLLALRAKPGQGRGVDLVNVDDVRITGSFRRGESEKVLRKLAAIPPGGVVPTELADEFQRVGYNATFEPTGPGQLRIEVSPGRAIRGIRVRGHQPLPVKAVHRVLSPAARPGSLARGQCVDRRTLRNKKTRPVSMCAPEDRACKRWEADELDRLQRFLYDSGFLEGRASMGLRCGGDGEAFLHIYFKKGRAFRVRNPKIVGNASSSDQRWIRRIFRPTVSPFIPIPKRVSRKHLDKAIERVEGEYATPRVGAASGGRRELQLPYPGVRIETNYERIGQDGLPAKGRQLPLVIDIQLGNGVRTGFLGNDHIVDNRLRNQLQLFKRREPATTASAAREAENLRNYYQGRGYMLADVRGRFDDFSMLKQLSFVINEGPKVRVRRVAFPDLGTAVEPGVRRALKREWKGERALKRGTRFTDISARADLALLLTELASRGYICATAQMRIAFWEDGLDTPGSHALIDAFSELAQPGRATWLESQLDAAGLATLRTQRRAGLFARIEINPGPRVVTSPNESIRYLEIPIPPSRDVGTLPASETGSWGARRMLRDGPLRRKGDKRVGGIPLRLDLDRDTERAVSQRYRDSGFPVADAEVRWVYEDTRGTRHVVTQAERLTNRTVGMCREQRLAKAVTVDTELSVYEGRRGTFGTTLIRGNFKTRHRVLEGVKAPGKGNKRRYWSQIEWTENQEYSRATVDKTRRQIEGTGVVSSVQIREQPKDCDLTDDPEKRCVVHEVVSMTESKDRFMDLSYGFGGATLDPLYAFVRPSFPNVGGSAWDINLDAHVGANVPAFNRTVCSGEDCYERSGRVSVVRPRIWGTPLTVDISAQLQRRVTPARGKIDSLLGQVRLLWPVSDNLRTYVGYLAQAANISKSLVKPTLGAEQGCGASGTAPCRPPDRSEAIVPDLTGGVELGATYQRVDNAFNPEDGFIATGDTLFVPSFPGRDNWIRAEISWQHFIPVRRTQNRINVRYMLRYGHAIPIPNVGGRNTTSIPEVWRFFGGGTAELGVRGIVPQTMLVDVERIETPFGVAVLRPTAQGGHIRALGTLAVQVVSIANLLGGKVAHSVFLDAGVLTQRWRQVVPIRDIRRSVGLNFLKWDISIVTVALGYAILVPNAIIPQNVRPTDDANGRFVFDVGATF